MVLPGSSLRQAASPLPVRRPRPAPGRRGRARSRCGRLPRRRPRRTGRRRRSSSRGRGRRGRRRRCGSRCGAGRPTAAAFDVAAEDRGRWPTSSGPQAVVGADPCDLLGVQQRAVAGHEDGLAEDARRRDDREGAVVHEHQLGVDVGGLVDLVVGEGAEGVALVRALVVVVRREVEDVGGGECGRRTPPSGDDVVGLGVEAGSKTQDAGREAVPEPPQTKPPVAGVVQRAVRIVALVLGDGVDVAVGGVDRGVAAAVRRVDADDAGQVDARAVPDVLVAAAGSPWRCSAPGPSSLSLWCW